jgi:sarcosine oxidase
MSMRFEHIVVGLGGHGSAAVAHLSKRSPGCGRVLGLEKYPQVSHKHGSSHGRSRIIRLAYFEDPRYVPLLQRSFELWRELMASQKCGALLTMTGGLMIGSHNSTVVKGTLRSVKEHNLPHEVLSAEEIRRRFPAFQPPLDGDTIGVLEKDAGYLVPELCVQAHCAVALENGAELRYEEALVSWELLEDRSGVRVVTTKAEYLADKIVLAVGAWAPEVYGKKLESRGGMRLHASRRVLYWFNPMTTDTNDEENALAQFKEIPVYIWDLGEGKGNFYGFPHQPGGAPGGVKVAMHYVSPLIQTECTPDTIDRKVAHAEVDAMRSVLKDRMPNLAGDLITTETCMYTNTPDEHFLIDWHPDTQDRVLLVSPCSGHGFKFCSVVGEIVADLLQHGTTTHDVSLFLYRPMH